MSYYFSYGTFDHPPFECYPQQISMQSLYTPGGERWAKALRMKIGGDLVEVGGVALTPATIATRMNAIDLAYNTDYHDAGFKFTADDTWTPHWINHSHVDNLSGNRVTYRSWDNALPTELANTRSFSVAIEAIFGMVSNDSSIISFNEQTTKQGTGGPKWLLYELANGDPVKEEITTKSKVIHVTSGSVVAYRNFVLPPLPYWPNEEQTWKRTVQFVGPRQHGHPSGRYTHYTTNYSYYFERLGPDPTTAFNTWYVPAV